MSANMPDPREAASAGVQVSGEVWDAIAGFSAAYTVQTGDASVIVPLWRDLTPAQQSVFMLAALDPLHRLTGLVRTVTEVRL